MPPTMGAPVAARTWPWPPDVAVAPDTVPEPAAVLEAPAPAAAPVPPVTV